MRSFDWIRADARRIQVGLVLLAVLAWLVTGLMMVDTGQVALVYRFGAIVRTVGAGLHWRLPAPFENDERIMVTEVRRVEPGARRLLTGDSNLVQLNLVVQYTVSDPVAFTLSATEPETIIANQIMAATSAAVAGIEVDTLLTTGRADLQRRVLEIAQAALDDLGLGVRLMAADIQEMVPPAPVVDAFNDVSSARGDRETLALSAEAYASKLLPDVRGRASQQVEGAKAHASERISQAQSETARFRALLPSWRKDPAATRVHLQTSAVEAVAPHLDVLVAPPGTELVLPSPQGSP